nr:protein-tyrosine phosphatase family protein [Endozoicomonas sp.]
MTTSPSPSPEASNVNKFFLNLDSGHKAQGTGGAGNSSKSPEKLAKKCFSRTHTVSESASGTSSQDPTKSISERRQLRARRLSLNLNVTKSQKSEKDQMVEDIGWKLSAKACLAVGEPVAVEGGAGLHMLYQVDRENKAVPDQASVANATGITGTSEKQKLFVHSMYLAERTETNDQTWAAEFWELVFQQDVTKVIALAQFGMHPSYMMASAGSYQDASIKAGDKRKFTNNYQIEIQDINPIEPLIESQEVKVLLTNNAGKTKTVLVDQIYCWSDSFPLENPEITVAIVGRISGGNIQIHCEGGRHRSPSLAVMHQLSNTTGLTKDNVVATIVRLVHHIRCQRHEPRCIEKNALKTIVDFALKITGILTSEVIRKCESAGPLIMEPFAESKKLRIESPIGTVSEEYVYM